MQRWGKEEESAEGQSEGQEGDLGRVTSRSASKEGISSQRGRPVVAYAADGANKDEV